MTQQHKKRPRTATKSCRPFACHLAMQGGSATLDISGVIGWDTDPMDFCTQVQAAKDAGCTSLTVRINSCGGYCYDGLAMGDKLRACGMRTRAEVCGQAMSMASYLLQCCDERVAHPNATIMFHQPSAGVYGTVDEIAEQARYLCEMRDKMFAAMAARCGTTGEAMSAAHQSMKLYSATQALENHMIDSIMDSAPAENAPAAPVQAAADRMPACCPPLRGKHGVVDYDPALRLLPAMQALPDDDDEEEEQQQEDDGNAAAPPQAPSEEGENAENPEKEKPEKQTDPDSPPQAPAQGDDDRQPAPAPDGDDGEEEDEDADAKPVALTPALLREAMRQAAQQGAAAALAQLGVPPASLPGNAAACNQSPAAEFTDAQLAKMPAMQRLAVLESNPRLAARFMGGNR